MGSLVLNFVRVALIGKDSSQFIDSSCPARQDILLTMIFKDFLEMERAVHLSTAAAGELPTFPAVPPFASLSTRWV